MTVVSLDEYREKKALRQAEERPSIQEIANFGLPYGMSVTMESFSGFQTPPTFVVALPKTVTTPEHAS